MSYISSSPDIGQARFTGHVWRAENGVVHATVELNDATGNRTYLAFDNPADARSLAAACTEAADAMDKFAPEASAPRAPEKEQT